MRDFAEVGHLVGEGTLEHLVVPAADILEEDTLVLLLVEGHIQAVVVHSQAAVDTRVVVDSPLVGVGSPVELDSLVVEGNHLDRQQDNQVELEAQHQEVGYTMEREMYNKHKDASKLSGRRNHTNHHLHHEAFPIDGSCVRKLRNSYDIKQEYRQWLHM